jgi:hypothetical protein
MARIFLARDAVAEAQECFLKAVRLESRNQCALLGLSIIALIKGDIAGSMRCTLAILPDLTADAAAGCVRLLLDAARPREAIRIAEAALCHGLKCDELDAAAREAIGQCDSYSGAGKPGNA